MIRTAAAAALAFALLAGAAGAARVDPVAIALRMQLTIKRQLQLKLDKAAPGMKVKLVTCTISANGVNGRCKAGFVYRTVRGYYTIVAKQPPKRQLSWSSTSVTCFNASNGTRVKC